MTGLDVHDLVAELTRPTQHREHYSVRIGQTAWGKDHVTRVPSLLNQLLTNTPSSTGDDTSGGGFRSQPAAHLESLDTLVSIDLEASRWVRDLGEDDPGDQLEVVSRTPGPIGPVCRRCQHGSCSRIRRGEIVVRRAIPGSGTIACVSKLHGLMASMERCTRTHPKREQRRVVCCTWHQAETDIRRWWTQARVVTGWDSPAWRPDNTCPNCDARGTLRIRLGDQSALCIECRETWDSASIGLLAEHIRGENHEEASAAS